MNAFLARAVAYLNSGLAILIILAFFSAPILITYVAEVAGIRIDPSDPNTAANAVLISGLVGMLTATIVCGFIAILCSIEKSLRDIRNTVVAYKVEPSQKIIRNLASPKMPPPNYLQAETEPPPLE